MTARRRRAGLVCLLVLLGCAGMAWVEGVLQPIYPVKSAAKAALFSGLVLAYCLLTGDRTPLRTFSRCGKTALRPALWCAGLVLIGILGGYAVIGRYLDLSAIPDNLAAKEGITAAVFPYAAAYITLCNSLLEELFFRGFAFLTLKNVMDGPFPWLFSAGLFALYHLSITDGWAQPLLLAGMVAGLTLGGLFFNFLDRDGSLWPGWIVHMAANLAINTIALHLFGVF